MSPVFNFKFKKLYGKNIHFYAPCLFVQLRINRLNHSDIYTVQFIKTFIKEVIRQIIKNKTEQ